MERFVAGPGAEVLVGRALSERLPERPDRERVAILTQPGAAANVAGEIASELPGVRTTLREQPDREEAKELDVVGEVYDQLADFNLGRHDSIV